MSTTLPPMRQLSEHLRTAAQLSSDEVKALAAQGVKTLICNRPDGEEEGQPSAESMRTLAESLGMNWYFLPVVSGQVMDEQGDEFGEILAQAEAPVVAYCRTGARCGCLWALSLRHERSGESLVESLKLAGYDMPDFFKRLQG